MARNKIAVSILSIGILVAQISWGDCPAAGGSFSEELLYWVADEKGLGFTNQPANVLITSDFTQNAVVDPAFEWEWGVRLGGGYTQRNRKWSYQSYWTYLQSKAHGQKSVDSGSPDFLGIYPIWSMGPDTLTGDYASSASSSWHLNLNMIDLLAQYDSTLLYNWLTFLPFLGARGVFLSQKMTADYAGGTFFSGVDENILRNSYLGAGPRLGLIVDCYLAYGLSLFGRAAAAPTFGRFHIKQRETYLGNIRFHRSTVARHLVLSTDFAAGFKWKKAVIQEKLSVILAVSWEGQEFFRINRFYRGNYHFFEKNRNLFLQGLTGCAALDF